MHLYFFTRPTHRIDQPFDPELDEVIIDTEEPQIFEPDTYDVIMAEYKRLGIA